MSVEIRDEGRYELFESTKGHRILSLGGDRWFAWIHGQRGEILVHSDADHQKDHAIQKGKFIVARFEGDAKFKDMPHLFLQKGSEYQELMIPNGLPTEDDPQKKVVATGDTIGRDELERYLEHPASGKGESRLRGHMKRPTGGSMSNVAHYLKGIDFPATGDAVVRYAREHGAPQSALRELRKIGERRVKSMADVMKAVGQGHERSGTEREVPIPNYDELTAEQASRRILSLQPRQLERVKRYERGHKNRKTVIEAIDRHLH